MAITEENRREITDLAMQVLDALAECDEDSDLVCAVLAFELAVPDEESGGRRKVFTVNWRTLGRCSPLHAGALLGATSDEIVAPDPE
jgi:hypothetical protein